LAGRRGCAVAFAALAVLAAAPAARAATLTVDDDGADCPAARFSSIQNALFAAAPQDTIAVCPGTYVEGSGAVGSNGLLIIKDVTIKGAGADLVTIRPRHTTAQGGQIAANPPNLRDGLGNIVTVDGDDTSVAPQHLNGQRDHLLTVNISGVTVDGDGVYAEAGVLYRDATGTITHSRITNVVTTERSLDTPRPGEFKGSSDGIAVASVIGPAPAAGDTRPMPGTPRSLTVDHTRIDKYNAGGVLIDGASNDAPPLTASGETSRGILTYNQIVGRTLCIDFLVNGNCQQPPPQPAQNGPLYGQDGVRITAGSTGALTGNNISLNLVQGTGAPVQSSNTTPNSTNNQNLSLGSGVRLIGAGASVLSQNNITTNAYGVFNATLDGTTANTAVPVKAENNWWGLRTQPSTGGSTNQPPLVNTGPAISPTVNPPIPENPVNGAPKADGSGTTSDAVDFFPFRNGYQSEPNTGEFVNVDVPGQVNDAAPTVTLTTSTASVHLGDTVKLTAAPADDFGIHRVVFYDGGAIIGQRTSVPYTLNYKIPGDVTCAARTLTALAEDSSGQTAASAQTITVNPADCAGTQPSPPASIAFDNPPLTLPSKGGAIALKPVAPAGIKQVDLFLGQRKVCTLTAAPFGCTVLPTGADVGIQVLRAVLTDNAGATTEATTRVLVGKFKPRGLSISASRTRLSGKLSRPARVTKAQGCKSGSVDVVTKRGGRILGDVQARLSRSCKYSTKRPAGARRGFTVTARFGGNAVLSSASKKRRFS
jgi:Bacterial Ig domain